MWRSKVYAQTKISHHFLIKNQKYQAARFARPRLATLSFSCCHVARTMVRLVLSQIRLGVWSACCVESSAVVLRAVGLSHPAITLAAGFGIIKSFTFEVRLNQK